MLKLKPDPTFLLPVEVPVAGQESPSKIKLVAKYRNAEELQAFFQQAESASVDDMVKQTVTGWNDVEGEFSADGLRELLANYTGLGLVILRSYTAEVHKALRGN